MSELYIERNINGILVRIPVTFDEVEALYNQLMDTVMREVEEEIRKEREAESTEVTYS